MNCPLCLDTVLDVTYHAGIELDICPNCRGVWLDRGELNRIVDETGSRPSATSPGRRSDRPTRPAQGDRGSRVDPDERLPDRRRTRRKQSFASRLGDVFEEIVDL
jgi:Zn-finger nucleic acid-binding protein